MRSEITLQLALEKAYPKRYKRAKDLSSAWYLFTPYQNKKTAEISYFKLMELPSSYRTSEEIYSRVLQRYNKSSTQILHQVDIIFIERCFQVSYYLLKASSNIISLRGFLELREDCGQKVESTVIKRLIQFFAHLQGRVFIQDGLRFQKIEKEPCSSFGDQKTVKSGNSSSQTRLNQFNFDIDSIGMTKNGNFKICDYSLYFLSVQDHSNHKKPYPSLSRKSSQGNLTFEIQNQDMDFRIDQGLLGTQKKSENFQKTETENVNSSRQKKRSSKEQKITLTDFSSQSSASRPSQKVLKNALRKIITRLTTLNKKFDLSNEDLYVQLIQNYPLSTANIFSRVLTLQQFNKQKIFQILSEERKQRSGNQQTAMKSMIVAAESQISDSVTVTDSFIESIDLNDGIEVIHGSFINSETGESKIKDSSSSPSNANARSTITSMIDSLRSKPKLKKSLQFMLILFIICLIAGGVYLTIRQANKVISCEQGQFKTEKGICLACSFGCSQCQNQQANACSLCRGTWFLVIKTYTDKLGKCAEKCDGYPFMDKSNICIDGQKQ